MTTESGSSGHLGKRVNLVDNTQDYSYGKLKEISENLQAPLVVGLNSKAEVGESQVLSLPSFPFSCPSPAWLQVKGKLCVSVTQKWDTVAVALGILFHVRLQL